MTPLKYSFYMFWYCFSKIQWIGGKIFSNYANKLNFKPNHFNYPSLVKTFVVENSKVKDFFNVISSSMIYYTIECKNVSAEWNDNNNNNE